MRTGLIRSFALLTLATSTVVTAAELKSEEDKTMYALGAAIGRSIVSFNLTPAELELVKAGLVDVATSKKPQVDVNNYMSKLQDLQKTRTLAVEQAFLAKSAAAKGVTKTASGLLYSVVKAGTGPSPKATDTVKVHYTGKLPNGEVFDSSVERKEPAEFPLNGVIACWTEGVQLMKVGGKSRLVCPSAIAYGERGSPPKIGPGATLVFDIELLEIIKKS
jgi:FKBP-type peptidyl-prolyl cis-trans isomerase FkpA